MDMRNLPKIPMLESIRTSLEWSSVAPDSTCSPELLDLLLPWQRSRMTQGNPSLTPGKQLPHMAERKGACWPHWL